MDSMKLTYEEERLLAGEEGEIKQRCMKFLVDYFGPPVGTHSAWVESSAIPYGNAVLGTRTNFDGSFQTAYLGKVPYYDMHITGNRAATVLVKCAAELTRDTEYDLFGWAVGEALELKVPGFTGIGRPPPPPGGT